MITEYILRAHTTKGMRVIENVSDIITKELSVRIEVIDHRSPDPRDFGLVEGNVWTPYKHICLDRHVAYYFGIDYFQISRIFDETGKVVGRKIGDYSKYIDRQNKPYHIIDTDIVHGSTMTLALRSFNTNLYSVPVTVGNHQDLIDMEDLFMNNSLLQTTNGIEHCNYLLNPVFFSKRTSLPEHLFEPMSKLFNKE